MKKMISVLLACLLVLGMIGCSESGAGSSDQLSIVTTIFPLYDWTREILGDNGGNVELTMLLDSGVDLHSYQPTVEDMAAITGCDLFVCVGGVSDGWVTDVLNAAGGTQPRILRLLELLDREETPEEEDHGHEADEHVWLSLKNAEIRVNL